MKYSIKEMQQAVEEIMIATIKVCEDNGIQYYCQAGTVLGAVRHDGPIPWDHDADIIIPNDQIDFFVDCCQRDLPKEYYVDYFTVDDKNLRQFPRIGKVGFSTDFLHLDVFRLIGLPNDVDTQYAMIDELKGLTANNALKRASYWKLFRTHRYRQMWDKIKLTGQTRRKYIEKFNEICNKYPYAEATYVMNPSGRYGKKNIFDKKVYGQGTKHKYSSFEAIIPTEYDFYLKQYYGDYMKYPDQNYIDGEMNKIFDVR